METQTAYAVPGEDGELCVYSSTQDATGAQEAISNMLDVSNNRVTVIVKRLGGGFGGKESSSIWASATAALCAKLLNRPVRVAMDREDDMASTGKRHPNLAQYKVGFTSTGKIVALKMTHFLDAGCDLTDSFVCTMKVISNMDTAYNIPHVDFTGKICKTNQPANCPMRGFGLPEGMFVTEYVMEKVAAYLHLPPHHIRHMSLYKEGDLTPYRQRVRYCTLDRLWDEIMRTSQFEARLKDVAKFNEEHVWRKRGLSIVPVKAAVGYFQSSMNQAGALVHLYKDGTVLLTHGGSEMGQGLHTKMIQIAASILQIPLESIYTTETSTARVPNTITSAGSFQSDLQGGAVVDACQRLNDRLSPLREQHPLWSFKELAKHAHEQGISLSATGFFKVPDSVGWDFKEDGKEERQVFKYFTYGVGVVEADVDALTGEQHMVRVDLLMDVGRSLNPALDVGQTEGAFMMGLGYMTTEQLVKDTKGGLTTRGPYTYKIPAIRDVPLDFRVALLQKSDNPEGIYNAKGVGEPPLLLAQAAFFAIQQAVAAARLDTRRHTQGDAVVPSSSLWDLFPPATCEKIHRACAGEVARLAKKAT
eukprot:TRINITY_DN4950_c0_g1_i2.p1 TRINITY_DN4950_c0_g1~~TRINITY_DN4950_c0_g1_i2.p1  ORF type:complete len:589 (+),score=140.28 TRINITY_DN4950_c0_g1_i2:1167-2933(+)